MTNITIPSALKQRTTLTIQLVSIFEKMRLFAPFSTVIRGTAKTIDVPHVDVDDAVNHGLSCKNSIGTATITSETISIDSKTDKSIDYCEDDFLDDKIKFKESLKTRIKGVIGKKVNLNMANALVADATEVVATVDLSTKELVNAFLISVGTDAGTVDFEFGPRVEHGTVIRAKYQGEAVVFAGTDAYKSIRAGVSLLSLQSDASNANEFIDTPQGVKIVNAGALFASAKQLAYGVAGAPLHAYRTDKVREFDDKITSRTTAGEISGDLIATDAVVQRDYNMGAEIWNKALIPTNTQAYFFRQLMA